MITRCTVILDVHEMLSTAADVLLVSIEELQHVKHPLTLSGILQQEQYLL
jgi:hypothetical protein